jgi:purine-binding chemotaxis protein CheW
VEAPAVREIVPLPEFRPLEETPAYVVGAFRLRGRIVPLVDLNLRFGRPPQPYRLEDVVIVLEGAESVIGILVNEVRNVRDVAPDERLPLPSYGVDVPLDVRFVTGLLPSHGQIVMLLDLDNLLHLAAGLVVLPTPEEIAPLSLEALLPGPDTEARAVLRERAVLLAKPPESGAQGGTTSFAVVRFGGEFFGIALPTIREFTELRGVTPIPCCPAHIVGVMNLRGDLLTVLDVAGQLGLPPVPPRSGSTIVVLNREDAGVGVLVEEVLDVIALETTERLSVTSPAVASGREHLRGALPYGKQMLSLLDLPSLLMQQNLIVNESP